MKGNTSSDFDQLSKIDVFPDLKEKIAQRADVPLDWIFYVQAKPLKVMSKPGDEKAAHIIKEDGSSAPIAEDRTSIINMLYEKGYLSARLYTHKEHKDSLDKTIFDEWRI